MFCHRFKCAVSLLVVTTVASTALGGVGFSDVSPTSIEVVLGNGESTVEPVSITIDVFCVRPFEIDVIASDPGADVTNLTGVLTNNCGGDTSAFDTQLTGDGTQRMFDLQFVDAEFGGVLDSIPTKIRLIPEPASFGWLAVGAAVLGVRSRRRAG